MAQQVWTFNVVVTTPCHCGAPRWFYCNCSKVVAEYEVENHRDNYIPKWIIDDITARHPGMDLTYARWAVCDDSGVGRVDPQEQ